jgi:thymidylate kinase
MFISVDGGDGVGKTTLVEKLAEYYNLYYLKKPIDTFLCVREPNDIRHRISKLVQKFVYEVNKSEKLKVAFNSSLLLHYKKQLANEDVIVDRGMLSCYMFNGDETTEPTFDKYIQKGLEFDICFFLTASPETRRERMLKRNPNDEDLKNGNLDKLTAGQAKAIKYAESRGIPVAVIDTDGKDQDQVFEEARQIMDMYLSMNPNARKKAPAKAEAEPGE